MSGVVDVWIGPRGTFAGTGVRAFSTPMDYRLGRNSATTPATSGPWSSTTPYITHIKRLREVADEVALFLERADQLGPKLGPTLFQLPPTEQVELARLRDFLNLLSKDRRWVIEFRHPSWQTSDVYQLLTDHSVALCIPVGGGIHPDRVTTAPFTYLRLHRGKEPEGGFTAHELISWAAQIRALRSANKEVYVYFNNDWGGYAIRDAIKLRELLGG